MYYLKSLNINSKNYVAVMDKQNTPIVVVDDNQNTVDNGILFIQEKQKAKQLAKSTVKKKWIRGQHYILKSKPKDGSAAWVKEFVCIGYAYSIKDQPVNVVIMKQVAGLQTRIYALNRQDCERLHIKYEPGLRAFSMEKNFLIKK